MKDVDFEIRMKIRSYTWTKIRSNTKSWIVDYIEDQVNQNRFAHQINIGYSIRYEIYKSMNRRLK